MKAYLVMNFGSNVNSLPFKEQYQVFTNRNVAAKHAVSCGFESPMGFSDTIGVKSVYYAGNVKVEFMPIEIQ